MEALCMTDFCILSVLSMPAKTMSHKEVFYRPQLLLNYMMLIDSAGHSAVFKAIYENY